MARLKEKLKAAMNRINIAPRIALLLSLLLPILHLCCWPLVSLSTFEPKPRGFYIDENALSAAIGSRLALRSQSISERRDVVRARRKTVHEGRMEYESRYRDEGTVSGVNVVISPSNATAFAKLFMMKVSHVAPGDLRSRSSLTCFVCR